jgi:hypothetical protein
MIVPLSVPRDLRRPCMSICPEALETSYTITGLIMFPQTYKRERFSDVCRLRRIISQFISLISKVLNLILSDRKDCQTKASDTLLVVTCLPFGLVQSKLSFVFGRCQVRFLARLETILTAVFLVLLGLCKQRNIDFIII